jgi:hypothetical protein
MKKPEDRMFFVIIKGDGYLLPLVDDDRDPYIKLYTTENEARKAAMNNFFARTIGFRVFEYVG